MPNPPTPAPAPVVASRRQLVVVWTVLAAGLLPASPGGGTRASRLVRE